MAEKLRIEVCTFNYYESLDMANNGWEIHSFQPEPVQFNKMTERTNNLSNFISVNKAVAITTENDVPLHLSKAGGAHSILAFRTDEEIALRWAPRTDVYGSGTQIPISTVSLKDYIAEKLSGRNIDELDINCAGLDLSVLQDMGDTLNLVKKGSMIAVISPETAIHVGQTNLLSDCRDFLIGRGFVITNEKIFDNLCCEVQINFASA